MFHTQTVTYVSDSHHSLPDQQKIAEGLGGPFHDFSSYSTTAAMRFAFDAKDEDKEVDAVLHLFRNYLRTSVPLFMYFH